MFFHGTKIGEIIFKLNLFFSKKSCIFKYVPSQGFVSPNFFCNFPLFRFCILRIIPSLFYTSLIRQHKFFLVQWVLSMPWHCQLSICGWQCESDFLITFFGEIPISVGAWWVNRYGAKAQRLYSTQRKNFVFCAKRNEIDNFCLNLTTLI